MWNTFDNLLVILKYIYFSTTHFYDVNIQIHQINAKPEIRLQMVAWQESLLTKIEM